MVWSSMLFILGIISILGMWFIGMKSLVIEIKVVSMSSSMIDLNMLVDVLSMSFVSLVFLISSCVFFYSSSYMAQDEMGSRLMYLMIVFIFSMIFLIMFPSLLSVILGWDGLGLSSFLLVVFFQNHRSLASGVLTALSNRVGDGLLIVAMGVSLEKGIWWSVFELSGSVSVFIGLASITKSAQVPFCAWLPAAMAAPTPVSSLVHSSTLVTAGVYLLLRYSVVEEVSSFLMVVSSMTMILGGVSALFEEDLKKVVALSTLSQLGMMVFVISMGFKLICLFHLYMHALLKASLFLGVGSMIHCRREQKILFMKGGVIDSPGSSSIIIISCAALSGVPFLCGWFSKDLILEVLLSNVSWLYSMIFLLGSLSSVIYSGRLTWMCVFAPIGSSPLSQSADCRVMLISMMMLLMTLLLSGTFFFYWLGVESAIVLIEVDKMSSIFIIFGGFIFVHNWVFLRKGLGEDHNFSDMNMVKSLNFWRSFWSTMWFLPKLSSEVGMIGLMGSKLGMSYLEQGWFEYFGGKGVSELWKLILSTHQRGQSGGFNMTMEIMIMMFFLLVLCVGLSTF
nr:NADH dehydrogenase subunit 5 [Anadara broughtonii]